MHICYVLGTFPTTSETFVSDEIFSLITAGHEVTIARIYKGSDAGHANVQWIKNNVRIIDIAPPSNTSETLKLLISACIAKRTITPIQALLRHKPRWAMTAMLATFKQLDLENIDHVHAHFADKQVLFAHALSALMKVPFSFTMHGYDIRDLPIGKENLFQIIDAAKCAFTTSAASLNALKKIGANIDTFDVIPCGINTSNFTARSKKYTGGALQIACVARLHPIKNHQALLQALSKVHIEADYQLKLIGDGELMSELKKTVNNTPRLMGKVSFLGSLSNEQVRTELLQCHAHVLPSKDEGGMPVANTEAMATGLLCIGANVGGIPEAIRHGENGLLFNPDKPEQLTNIIENICRQRIDTETISNTARSDALTRLDQNLLLTRKIKKMLAIK